MFKKVCATVIFFASSLTYASIPLAGEFSQIETILGEIGVIVADDGLYGVVDVAEGVETKRCATGQFLVELITDENGHSVEGFYKLLNFVCHQETFEL